MSSDVLRSYLVLSFVGHKEDLEYWPLFHWKPVERLEYKVHVRMLQVELLCSGYAGAS